MGSNRWQGATTERGKPRIYIQQYLDLKLPDEQYTRICKELGLEKPFEEESAATVMEAFLEEQGDGAQCESVHLQRGDGLVILMTVVSYPYKQATFDQLMAAHMAKKAMGQGK
ncbi:MAG: hypothetical protein ACOY93_17785 [Bacillota bacterium]